jgi:8-oxo-dGTP diphosphatase
VIRLKSPRLAVRGLVMHDGRLLIVNAYPGQQSDLWCAPGGGAEPGQSLPDNLVREIHEETGLTVGVGAPALVNEFHDPASGFHQVDVYFRCEILGGDRDGAWTDPEGIVNRRRWVSRSELAALRHKPDSLAAVAWGPAGAVLYDPLEPIVR